MYYEAYLYKLCSRRSWPEPLFKVERTPMGGYIGAVLVNDRVYTAGHVVESAQLAKEHACCQAFIICRNFSQLNGMHPDGVASRDGFVQGRPVQNYRQGAAGFSPSENAQLFRHVDLARASLSPSTVPPRAPRLGFEQQPPPSQQYQSPAPMQLSRPAQYYHAAGPIPHGMSPRSLDCVPEDYGIPHAYADPRPRKSTTPRRAAGSMGMAMSYGEVPNTVRIPRHPTSPSGSHSSAGDRRSSTSSSSPRASGVPWCTCGKPTHPEYMQCYNCLEAVHDRLRNLSLD